MGLGLGSGSGLGLGFGFGVRIRAGLRARVRCVGCAMLTRLLARPLSTGAAALLRQHA